MEENIEFERCIEFLVRMIEKYGDVLEEELFEEKEKRNELEKKRN